MRATATAHPNIALIKYWGKRDYAANLPAVGSLSITLGALRTTTCVEFQPGSHEDSVLINGAPDPAAQRRASACLDVLRRQAGVTHGAHIEAVNDFPTAAGLASSASGFAALAVAAAAALRLDLPKDALVDVARLGSGSAPRSLFGGFALLRNAPDGIRCEQWLAAADWPLVVVVAITSDAAKAVSSREGMALSRATSPFYPAWVSSHEADLAAGRDAVRRRDFAALAELAEHSCLKMHAVMLATRPALLYWCPATLACMHAVRELRAHGTPVFFTIDAGPQVKAICLPEAAGEVKRALAAVSGVTRILESGLGEGARVVG